jgi:hypothetical protein
MKQIQHLKSALPERLEKLEELQEGELTAVGDGTRAETLDAAYLLLDAVHAAEKTRVSNDQLISTLENLKTSSYFLHLGENGKNNDKRHRLLGTE